MKLRLPFRRPSPAASPEGTTTVPLPAGFTGLFLATPSMRDSLKGGYVRSLLNTQNLIRALNLPIDYFLHAREGMIDRARDHMTAAFMASACSHMLQIDDDIEWPAEAVVRLLTHARHHDVVMGIYRRKRPEIDYPVCWLPDSNQRLHVHPESGCVEIEAGPGGFLLVSRAAIHRLQEAHPELHYETCREFDAQRYALYAGLQEGLTRFGEDISFCRRWRAVGGQVWMDPYIDLVHWGDADFPARPMADIFRPQPAAQSGAA